MSLERTPPSTQSPQSDSEHPHDLLTAVEWPVFYGRGHARIDPGEDFARALATLAIRRHARNPSLTPYALLTDSNDERGHAVNLLSAARFLVERARKRHRVPVLVEALRAIALYDGLRYCPPTRAEFRERWRGSRRTFEPAPGAFLKALHWYLGLYLDRLQPGTIRSVVEAAMARSVVSQEEATGETRPIEILTWEAALRLPPAPQLITGLYPLNAVAVDYGDYGSLKSMRDWDESVALASGAVEWHGFPIPEAVRGGACIQVYAEGGGGVGQRLEALRLAWHVQGNIPFFPIAHAVNVSDPATVRRLILAIRAMVGGRRVVKVSIDTYDRNSAGRNLNQQQDVMAVVAGLDAIREELGGPLVKLIGHTNAQGGFKGSTNLPQAADTKYRFDREGNSLRVRLTNEKQKDGEQGGCWEMEFRPEANGVPVVARVTRVTAQEAEARPKKDPLTPNRKIMLDLLIEVGGLGRTEAEWRHQGDERHSINPKSTFNGIRDWLSANEHTRKVEGRWYALKFAPADV